MSNTCEITVNSKEFIDFAHIFAKKKNLKPKDSAEARQFFAFNWETITLCYCIEKRGPFFCKNISKIIEKIGKSYYKKFKPNFFQKLFLKK